MQMHAVFRVAASVQLLYARDAWLAGGDSRIARICCTPQCGVQVRSKHYFMNTSSSLYLLGYLQMAYHQQRTGSRKPR